MGEIWGNSCLITTNFSWYRMVHEWYRIMVQIWYKYGTSMVQSQNMVQLWRKFGRIMVQNYGTIMDKIWGTRIPPNFAHNCTILYHNLYHILTVYQTCTILWTVLVPFV